MTKRFSRWALALAALATLLFWQGLALAAPKGESGISFPHDASVDGHRIDWLINVTSIFVILMFVIMCIWMLWAVFAHDEKHEAEYDHGDSKHHIMVALSISAAIFFIVDGNLWINSTIDLDKAFWNFAGAEAHGESVRIEINAHQWAWDARYAGPDGKFNTNDDVVMLNDIRVPVDTPVLLQLASTDVIHSFTLPNFRVKQDAVPGMINRLWFQAKETGEFDVSCGQHCGTHHYKMKGQLTVMKKEDYTRWLKQASASSTRSFDVADKEAHWGWDWKAL